MKKVIYGALFLAIVGITIVSCQKDKVTGDVTKSSNSNTQSNDRIFDGFDEFFDEISSTDYILKKDEVVYLNYSWNKKTNKITLLNTITSEPNFIPLYPSEKAEEYTVSCSNGDASWDATCNGKWSCGSKIYECLEAGGCAEICTATAVFLPQANAFMVGNSVTLPVGN